MKKYVLIVAGGKGVRMGADLPKQFIPIEGKPILMHTLEAFYRWDQSARITLILPDDHQTYWRMLCKEIGCSVPHAIVNGGDTRFHSVRNGLEFLSEEIKNCPERDERVLVAVHDGVRPFVPEEVITACFRQAEKCSAAIPVIPLVDSLREVNDAGSFPVDRSHYVAVQTPQVFEYGLLKKVYGQPYSSQFTDDASVVESLGFHVDIVEGNRENIKITTPFDLLVGKALLAEQNKK